MNPLSFPVTGDRYRKWLWGILVVVPLLYLVLTRGPNYGYDNGYVSVGGHIIYNKPQPSSSSSQNDEIRSSPAPDHEAMIQIYCDITTGKWSPGYNDRRYLQNRWYHPSSYTASSASSSSASTVSSSFRRSRSAQQDEFSSSSSASSSSSSSSSSTKLGSPSTTAHILRNVMRTPNWYSLMDDHTRRQYAWLVKRRYHSERILFGSNNENSSTSTTKTESLWKNYSLDIEDNNPFPGLSIINEMFAMQDETKTGVSMDKPPNPATVWLWPFTELWPMPSYVGIGNEADRLSYYPSSPSSSTPSPPFVTEQLRNVIGDRSFLRTNPIHHHFSSLNTTDQRSGNHAFDSLQMNTTIDPSRTYIPYVTPLFTFRLTTSTINKLRSSELRTVRFGMQRTCAAMHTSWQGRLLETVNDFYGTFRDSGCDISCEYNHENNACKYHSNTHYVKKASRSGTPIAVLSELTVHIDDTDTYSFSSSTSSNLYESVPLPYIAQDEAYAVHIDATHTIGTTKHAPSETATVPIYSLEGHIHAPFLWGSLYGLETFNQIIENWSIERIGVPNDEQFTSPVYDILTGTRTIPQTSDVMELAKAAASHVSSKCVTEPPVTNDKFYSNKKFIDYTLSPFVTLPLLIVDQPWKRWRGLSLDTSRHWLPVESILTTLDGMAYTKMNVLHWHFSDAQSFPFLLASHPEIAQKGAWDEEKIYTRKDIIAIVKYAARRGIRVVPEMDSPAHAAALGKSHPEVLVDCSSIAGGNLKLMDLYSLDPSQEQTFTLISDIFNELGTLFPDKYFHIGADEVAPECWASDKRVKEWSRTNLDILYKALPSGLLNDVHATYAVLLAYFLHRIHNIVVAMGKFAVSWEDSFEKLHSTIRSRRLSFDRAETFYGDQPLTASSSPFFYSTESLPVSNDTSLPSLQAWCTAGSVLFRVLQDYPDMFDERSRSAVFSTAPSAAEPFVPPRKDPENRRTEENSVLPPNFPTPVPKKGIQYLPQTIIEGWKCWVHHADDVVLAGAQTYVNEVEKFVGKDVEPSSLPLFSSFLHKNDTSFLYYVENFGVLQASCWYLDYSSPWGDYYKHWPLPEHSRGVAETANFHDRLSSLFLNYTQYFYTIKDENVSKKHIPLRYPKAIFGKTPYLGGEAAMWTERVDTSNVLCRSWPRTGIIGEVTWSESLVYDRYARYYGQDPPFPSGSWYPRNDNNDKLLSLFAAPRYLSFTRRLIRRYIPSSTTAVFDVAPSSASSAASLGFNDFSILKIPAPNFETDMFPFNGMCPGIEQTIQRSKKRINQLLDRNHRNHDHDEDLPEKDTEFEDDFFTNYNIDTNPLTPKDNIYYTKNFTFMSWNIHDGGGSHNRYQQILDFLREMDTDVVGLVEANGWENSLSRQLLVQNRNGNEETDTNDLPPVSEKFADKFGAFAGETADSVPPRKGSEPFVPGADEVLYREGKPLAGLVTSGNGTIGSGPFRSTQERSVYDYIDTSAHVTQQTAGFRRRAASAGYTYSHILLLPSGYHLALLSVRPMTIVYEDTEHFERGILVADINGIRFMLIHLHAQSATERFRETQWIAELIRQYNTAGIPLVILGDFNSLSPFDALCHQALDTIDRLEGTDVPLYLRSKYLCHYDNDEDCVHQKVFSGTDKDQILQIDYRPMFNILDAVYDNFVPNDQPGSTRDSSGSSPVPYWTLPSPTRMVPSYDLDFTLWYYKELTMDNYTVYYNENTNTTTMYPRTCVASYPTSALGKNADDAGENGLVPLRIDHVIGNTLMYNLVLPYHIQCYVGNTLPNEHPISHLLEMSDHLPVICRVE